VYNYDRRIAAEPGGSAEFMEKLKGYLSIGDRQISMRNQHGIGGADAVYVNFVNLPKGHGGGAESENNRASFWIRGFDKADEHAAPPTGKVKVEMSNSALYSGEGAPSRETRVVMRAKTGTPDQVAKYLADFLNNVVKKIPPRYTHSNPELQKEAKRLAGAARNDSEFAGRMSAERGSSDLRAMNAHSQAAISHLRAAQAYEAAGEKTEARRERDEAEEHITAAGEQWDRAARDVATQLGYP